MKAITEGGAVVMIMSEDEATHIGHRLSCSSTQTFSKFRDQNKLSGLHRHPMAENYLAALADVGVTPKDC